MGLKAFNPFDHCQDAANTFIAGTASATGDVTVPKSAVWMHVKNRTGSTNTVAVSHAASVGSYVLAAGEEILLPVAGMNDAGEYSTVVTLTLGASTNADYAFHVLTKDGA